MRLGGTWRIALSIEHIVFRASSYTNDGISILGSAKIEARTEPQVLLQAKSPPIAIPHIESDYEITSVPPSSQQEHIDMMLVIISLYRRKDLIWSSLAVTNLTSYRFQIRTSWSSESLQVFNLLMIGVSARCALRDVCSR